MTRRLLAYLIAAGVFALDRITKIAIDRLVPLWETREVIPGFFNIVHTENAAAAFSLFAGLAPGWRRFFLVGSSSVAAILLSVLLWRDGARAVGSRMVSVGLALILGGAVGNLYDRVIPGTVTDFLELYVGSFRWPAFNVADSAISIGAGLVLLDLLLARRVPKKD
ncbi:MAG TPA: signal peptidase II [Bryobacteraceae bacterium]|nr:signal peptidase II [Bryobacteraceae bacterium]